MPMINTWADIEALGGEDYLLPAEKLLRDACLAGIPCFLEGQPNTEIRADILRYFLLGGCDTCPVTDKGTDLYYAKITGTLDLSFATCKGETSLIACVFDHQIYMQYATCETLYLNKSTLHGINAQGLKVHGNCFLDEVTAHGVAIFTSVKIEGQFNISNSMLVSPEGVALNAQGMRAKGGAFLNNLRTEGEVIFSGAVLDSQFKATGAELKNKDGIALNALGIDAKGDVFLDNVNADGEVILSAATMGGHFTAINAVFSNPHGIALRAQGLNTEKDCFLIGFRAHGEVSLSSAQIGGNLELQNAEFQNSGTALQMENARVIGTLWWKNTVIRNGVLTLGSLHVGTLADDLGTNRKAWPAKGALFLNGFVYDYISDGTMDPELRLEWVKQGCEWKGEFFPQPFTQLAHVFQSVGHETSAQDVLTRREHLRRKHRRKAHRIVPNGDISVAVKSVGADLWNLWDKAGSVLFNNVAGYGHKPFRSLKWLVYLTLFASIFSYFAWQDGAMAPNSGQVLTSKPWLKIAQDPTVANPAVEWTAKGAAGQDWETFFFLTYAADIVIPIINFGQTDAWAPSTERGWWGKQLWWLRWVFTVLGWVVTALGAAAITSVIRRE